MFVKPFAYERVDSLAEACDRLRAYGGEARALAGGQSLLPMINLGLVEPRALVDISRVRDAHGLAVANGWLRIGALTRYVDLERDSLVERQAPLLRAAIDHVGNARVRVRGTVGGSLAHADPAAELPLVMTVLDAEYGVTDGRSERTVRSHELPVTYFTTSLTDGELIAWVRLPVLPRGWGWGFAEVTRRRGDFAVAAAAAIARCADGVVIESRVAVAGVGDRPLRLAAVEAAVDGGPGSELDRRIGPIEGIEPVSDTMASAAYRKHVARALVVRALRDACVRSEAA